MTRAQITSLVHNKISGAYIAGAETAVHEASVRMAINVAIRYFFKADYRESRREMQRMDGVASIRHNPVSPGFVRRFDLDILKEDPASAVGATRLYVLLDALPMLFGRMHWLSEVYPHVEGLNPHDFIGGGYRILSDRMSLRGIDPLVMQGIGFAYPEVHGNGEFRIYLFNAHDLLEKAVVYYVPDPSTLGDNEELLLPAGVDMMVADKAYEFFREPRLMPADLVIDERDDSTKIVRR